MNQRLLALAALVFLASNLAFAPQLQMLPATLLALGVFGSAVLFLRRSGPAAFLDAPINTRLLGACAALSLVLCLLGGEGHLFYPTSDWLTRDAVLADLALNDAPVHSTLHGVDYVMRAPLGMYLLPALAGKMFGLHGAHMALLFQNSLLFAIAFYLAGALVGGFRLVLLLVAFSGMDVLPVLVTSLLPHAPLPDGATPTLYRELLSAPTYAFSHDALEWWNGELQYSSVLTQMFWVPNHALPGWYFALLCLLAARREVDVAMLGSAFAALMIWSPLAVLPGLALLPFFAWRARATLFGARLWLGVASAACFLPVALYLTAAAASIPSEPLVGRPGFALLYVVFLLVEIPHALLLAWLWDKVAEEYRGLLLLCLAVLLILPLTNFGPSNDIVMRGSIAPLFVLAFVFATVALVTPRASAAGQAIFVIVALGALTPLREIRRPLVTPSFAISACNLITATQQLDPSGVSSNYLAPSANVPAGLLRAPRAAPQAVGSARCWPDHPVQEAQTGAEKPEARRQ